MMMKNVAIATDSHSSITPEMAQTLGVAVLPMPFTIDGTCYLEEETLTRAEFYAHQRRGAKIATSQPAPADVTALWDNLLTDHDAGDDAATIKRKLEAVREDMCIYVAVETLEHLKRGGRISTATALIGTLLHIKPILHFTTGTLGAYKKARGMNRAQDVMIEAIRAELAGRFAEPLAQGRVTLLAASSASQEATAAWEAHLQAEFPGMKLLSDQLSLGVSCHIGEGGMGVGLSVSPE